MVNAALASAPTTAPSKVRLQSADPAPVPPRLVLPSPEELGLNGAAMAPGMPTIDWNLTHQRLKSMAAVGFHLDHLPAGQVRVTFWLPTPDPSRTQLIEATARCESEAVALAFRQADALRSVKR